MRRRRAVVLPVLSRAGIVLGTLAVLALPAVTYRMVRTEIRVADRYAAPALPPLDAADQALYTRAAGAPGRSFAVLGYHDLTTARQAPANGGMRTVPVVAFATQLRMLALAGYRSVSAVDVAASLRGGPPLPRRAVLITFAGGRARTWTHADAVLARYRFRATVFVDPAQIGARSNLNWEELAAMVRTGRWSVGASLPGAASVPAGAGGARTSVLFAGDRRTSASRLGRELRKVRDAITGHGLPQPLLLCYPFQSGYPFDRVGDRFADVVRVVDRYFAAGLLNTAPDRLVTRSWIVRRLLPRLVVFGATTDALLFARLQEAAARDEGVS